MRLASLAVMPLLALAGCAAPDTVAPPVNPTPQELFAMEAWADGTPVAPVTAIAFVDMVIDDTRCTPSSLMTGLPAVPIAKRVEVPMQQGDDGRFRADIIRDPFLSKDLYGKGPCVWRASSVGVEFRDAAARYGVSLRFAVPPAEGRQLMAVAAIQSAQWTPPAGASAMRLLPLVAPGVGELLLQPGESATSAELLANRPKPGFAHVAMLLGER